MTLVTLAEDGEQQAGARHRERRRAEFVERRRNVVGLYVDPLAHDVVLFDDERAICRLSTALSLGCR